MRILVVEGQRETALKLQRVFVEHGHVVDVAFNGVDGLHLASGGAHDLLVVDDHAADFSALQLLSEVKRHRHVSVILISQEDSVDERVRGLRMGADDYLVKPFAFSELLARVQALGRRHGCKGQVGDRLILGDLELDLQRTQATRQGCRLALSAQEFTLLSLLLRRQGTVLSRTELLEQLWDHSFDSDSNVVDVAIRRLRAKMDAPFDNKLLHTVRGMGYILELRDDGASGTLAPR